MGCISVTVTEVFVLYFLLVDRECITKQISLFFCAHKQNQIVCDVGVLWLNRSSCCEGYHREKPLCIGWGQGLPMDCVLVGNFSV